MLLSLATSVGIWGPLCPASLPRAIWWHPHKDALYHFPIWRQPAKHRMTGKRFAPEANTALNTMQNTCRGSESAKSSPQLLTRVKHSLLMPASAQKQPFKTKSKPPGVLIFLLGLQLKKTSAWNCKTVMHFRVITLTLL